MEVILEKANSHLKYLKLLINPPWGNLKIVDLPQVANSKLPHTKVQNRDIN